MRLSDVVNRSEYESIKANIFSKSKFEYAKEVSGKKGKMKLILHSNFIDEELANSTWKGNRYLYHVHLEIKPKGSGYTGFGFANYETSMFETWDSFKRWLKVILGNHCTIEEEDEQMSLFD